MPMSLVTAPINQSRAPDDVPATTHNWTSGKIVPAALTSKNTASIAPQNVEPLRWQDVVDAINPLQQIPVVGEVYRGLTGTKISGIARVAGGFLYGGIAGGLSAAMVAAYAEANDGHSPAEQAVAEAANPVPAGQAPGTPPPPTSASLEQQDVGKGSGSATIPTVTVTARDARAAQAAQAPAAVKAEPAAATSQPATTAPQPQAAAAEPLAAPTASANPTTAPAELQHISAADLPPAIIQPPLRERLNQKRATPGFSNSPHPLAGSSFIDQLPAGAAGLTLSQPQNLALLQGVTNPAKSPGLKGRDASTALQANSDMAPLPNPADPMAAPSTPVAGLMTPQHNSLPPELVRDMMMQALDKYQKLPNMSASDSPISGLQ